MSQASDDISRIRARLADPPLPLINPNLVAFFKGFFAVGWFLGTLLAIGHTLWEITR